MALSTDFKDDILNESVNEKRKYQMTYNDDGTVSFTDVTSYSQTGSEYGAAEVNEERQAINELNSALESVESGYLKRYGYTMGASENSINFILPASISGWAYLTFLVVIANNIAAINVIGDEVGSSLSSNGITLSIIVGSNITAESIKESGKIRVKCRTSQVSAPVSIIPLRKGVTIESAYTSYTP